MQASLKQIFETCISLKIKLYTFDISRSCITRHRTRHKGNKVNYNQTINPQKTSHTSPLRVDCGCISDLGVIGERQEAQILKFNAPPPYTLSLSYSSYSKFSQLSYEHGCSRELWCRKCATWLWNKYVLIFSKTLFYTHIQRHTALAGTKCYKTM